MTTTPLGIPIPALGDAPNGPSQMSAAFTEIDTLITARLVPAARLKTSHGAMSGLSSGSNPVGPTWSTDAYNVGDITYASGVFTVARAGLYVWSCTFVAGASNPASSLEVRVLVNGSGLTQADGAQMVAPPSGFVAQAGGPIPLAASDQVQLDMYVNANPSGITVTPSTFGLYLVG